MLEGMGKRVEEAGAVVATAEPDNLWHRICHMAAGLPWAGENPFSANASGAYARTIIEIGQREGWSAFRVALAIAYMYMAMAKDHERDIMEIVSLQSRPIVMNRHCEGCRCMVAVMPKETKDA